MKLHKKQDSSFMKKLAVLLAIAAAAVSPSAMAQTAAAKPAQAAPAGTANDPKPLGSFGAWGAYVYREKGNDVCYMAAKPTKDEGNYKRRGDIFAMIIHRPAEQIKGEVMLVMGYDFTDGTPVKVQIGSESFELVGQGEQAFTRDPAVEAKLVKALRGGSQMIVSGKSRRGTVTTDTYSLSGSGKAHDAINTACKVK